jgi:hypothetical protein
MHIAVVGHGNGIHAEFMHTLGKVFDFACTVKQTVFGV